MTVRFGRNDFACYRLAVDVAGASDRPRPRNEVENENENEHEDEDENEDENEDEDEDENENENGHITADFRSCRGRGCSSPAF